MKRNERQPPKRTPESDIHNHSDATPQANELAGAPSCFTGFSMVPLPFRFQSAGFPNGFLTLECPNGLANSLVDAPISSLSRSRSPLSPLSFPPPLALWHPSLSRPPHLPPSRPCADLPKEKAAESEEKTEEGGADEQARGGGDCEGAGRSGRRKRFLHWFLSGLTNA